jgi:hypothetical protein
MENQDEQNRNNQDPEKKTGLAGAGETGETLGGNGGQDQDYQGAGEWAGNPEPASVANVDMQEDDNDKTGPSLGSEFTAQDYDSSDGDQAVKDVEDQGDQEAVAVRAAQKAECDHDHNQPGGGKDQLEATDRQVNGL